MPEWKTLNVRKICGSGSKPKICDSKLPWKLKLNLLLRTRHSNVAALVKFTVIGPLATGGIEGI